MKHTPTTPSKATPTPWFQLSEHKHAISNSVGPDWAGDEHFVAGRIRTSANAAFIVRACNAHEKLLAAVKMVFDTTDEGGGMNDIDWDMLRDAYNLGLNGEA